MLMRRETLMGTAAGDYHGLAGRLFLQQQAGPAPLTDIRCDWEGAAAAAL